MVARDRLAQRLTPVSVFAIACSAAWPILSSDLFRLDGQLARSHMLSPNRVIDRPDAGRDTLAIDHNLNLLTDLRRLRQMVNAKA